MHPHPHAIVLTATPGSGPLTKSYIESLTQASSAAGTPLIDYRRLADDDACEFRVLIGSGEEVARLCTCLANATAAHPIDANILADTRGPRRKKLLIADMESTMIEQEMLDELADHLHLGPGIAEVTARAMRGELDFEAALKERVALLAGVDARVLDAVAERITLMPGAEPLIRTMKANGAYCALVSGGFTVFTERVAKRLGFDEHQANVLETADGKLTGRVLEPILGRAAKHQSLSRLAGTLGIAPQDSIAVGDGANDLDMLKAAGLGVAFRAKPIVRAEAPVSIVHGDLTALLYLQGYMRDEFTGASSSAS